MLLRQRLFKAQLHNMGVHCSKVQVYRCGSAGQPLMHFTLEYSDLPPSVFQKLSGSEPSLTNKDCFSGCKIALEIVHKGGTFTIFRKY